MPAIGVVDAPKKTRKQGRGGSPRGELGKDVGVSAIACSLASTTSEKRVNFTPSKPTIIMYVIPADNTVTVKPRYCGIGHRKKHKPKNVDVKKICSDVSQKAGRTALWRA